MKTVDLQASIAAGQALILATRSVSASLDKFSGWLVAGFGGALALFIANLDTVSRFVSLSSIKVAATLFVASAILAVLNKFCAAFIAAGTTAAIEGASLGRDIAERGVQLDSAAFFGEIERALYWPMSWYARRSFLKVGEGDFSGPGRMQAKAGQIQSILVILQAAVSLVAVMVIVCGLAV